MKNRILTLLLVLSLFVSLFTGCATEAETTETETTEVEATEEAAEETAEEAAEETSEEQTEEAAEEAAAETVTDVLGYEIEVPSETPTKIVSLTPSNTEILYALGLIDNVIGVDEYSDYPEEVADIEKVGGYSDPNVEAIIALEPDIVFGGNSLQEDAIAQLNDAGIKIAAVEATSYEEIYTSIELIATLTCTTDTAEEVIAEMREEEAAIVALAEAYEGEAISAYYVLSAGEYGNWTSGPGSLINDMFEMLGIEVITDIEDASSWMEFSLETLIAEDPDVIVLSSNAYLSIEDLCALDGYKELTACTEGNVVMVDASVTERPAVRIISGLEEIYNAVYGE